VQVRADVEMIHGFSAHADSGELIRWMKGFRKGPKRAFIVHGEPDASAALSEKIERELGWQTHIPIYCEEVAL
jgi:metallo-beta-lactamase family protein